MKDHLTREINGVKDTMKDSMHIYICIPLPNKWGLSMYIFRSGWIHLQTVIVKEDSQSSIDLFTYFLH